MSLPPPRKKLRTEEVTGEIGNEVTAQSASRSSGERVATEPERRTPPRATGTSAVASIDTTPPSSRPSGSFTKADPSICLALVQDIVKSWDLSGPGVSDPPPVSGEEIGMVEAFA